MAVTDAYADAPTYRGRIGKTDTSADPAILVDLTAVSRYVDRYCGRFFTKDLTPQAHIYYPEGYFSGNPEAENPWRYVRGARVLYVDDIADQTGLVIKMDKNRDGSFTDETALAANTYQLMPLNADKGPEPSPWTAIHIPWWSSEMGWWPGAMVQVTAIHGWPAIPSAIVRATIDLTAIWRLETPRATQRIPEGMDQAFAEAPSAQKILTDVLNAYQKKGSILV